MEIPAFFTYPLHIVLVRKIMQGLGETLQLSLPMGWKERRCGFTMQLTETGYGAPASPACLLTVHNVCLNHVVLLGLTNIFQLVSFSAAEKGGDVEGPGGRFKLSSPSVRHVFFMSFPLFFLILFYSPFLWQPAFPLQVLGSEKRLELAVSGEEREASPC